MAADPEAASCFREIEVLAETAGLHLRLEIAGLVRAAARYWLGGAA